MLGCVGRGGEVRKGLPGRGDSFSNGREVGNKPVCIGTQPYWRIIYELGVVVDDGEDIVRSQLSVPLLQRSLILNFSSIISMFHSFKVFLFSVTYSKGPSIVCTIFISLTPFLTIPLSPYVPHENFYHFSSDTLLVVLDSFTCQIILVNFMSPIQLSSVIPACSHLSLP